MVQPVLITDPDDPRIAGYRHVRDREVAERRDAFIAEGEVVLRTVLKTAPQRLSSVLLAERQAERLAEVLQDLPDSVVRYTAPQTIMDQIVGFHIHRGILATGARGSARSPEDLLGGLTGPALVLALCGIGNHDNMGGIFRNAAAFGVGAVLLDSSCCDPLYRKAIRVSVGASLTTPFARLAPGADLLALLESYSFQPLAFSPWGSRRLGDVARAPRMAVLLGTEGPGLTRDLLARAHTVAIPMSGALDSLNVAVTCGIALHHLRG